MVGLIANIASKAKVVSESVLDHLKLFPHGYKKMAESDDMHFEEHERAEDIKYDDTLITSLILALGRID